MSIVAGGDIQKTEYTKFIITLKNEITRDILDKLKYALRYDIQAATLEKLKEPLDIFKELEKRGIVGPENLDGLRKLLEMIQKQDLVSMLDDFVSSCCISPSKVIAKSLIQNYLEHDNYCLEIRGGQHYQKEYEGEYVELTSGSSYALVIKNFNSHRCLCIIKIDGHVVCAGTMMYPFQKITVERPTQRNGKFKFLALDHAPPGSGINKWKNGNGLVEVTFTPDRVDMIIICLFREGNVCSHLTCSNETTDVGFRKMISVIFFDEVTAFSVHFGYKPIGQRNIKLTEYGIHNESLVDIKLGLIGGGLLVPPSSTQYNENNNEAPKWIPGATTLQGESEQTFGWITDDFVPDQEKSTTLYLRLVARADDNPPQSNKECTPLARETLVPPPMANW